VIIVDFFFVLHVHQNLIISLRNLFLQIENFSTMNKLVFTNFFQFIGSNLDNFTNISILFVVEIIAGSMVLMVTREQFDNFSWCYVLLRHVFEWNTVSR